MSLFNRAEVIDENFISFLNVEKFPQAQTNLKLNQTNIRSSDLISIFESQIMSRHIDLKARSLKDEGKCFYTIGSSGHEGNAVFGSVFPYTDTAFLHYRSAPFFLERSKQIDATTPLYDMALSFMASSDDPISGGRHKVIGSKLLNIPPQTSTIASHLPKAVGMAFSINLSKSLNISDQESKSNRIVICSFGDASVNHASALSAFNTASWIVNKGGHVPIVFICEDNGFGISVKTDESWIEENYKNRPGIKYIKTDGLHILDLIVNSSKVEKFCRINRKPIFLHMKTVRLMGHAGSDVEIGYQEIKDIENAEFNDPILHSSRILIENKCLSKEEIIKLYENSRDRVSHVFDAATLRPTLNNSNEVMSSIISHKLLRSSPEYPSLKDRKALFGKDFDRLNQYQNMAKLINYGLCDILLQYKNTVVFGEDVAEKGGVYHVTADLHK